MVQAEQPRHNTALRLSTTSIPHVSVDSHKEHPSSQDQDAVARSRPSFRSSATSEETIRATPPMNIPEREYETAIAEDGPQEMSFMELYMRTRQPSVSFNDEVQLDSGHKQSIDEPLEKPAKTRPRGRSVLQAISDQRAKDVRAHSESDQKQYDPKTGRLLAKYSTTPPREQAHVGEGRFPLLQSTVDAMATESQSQLPQLMSLTSESTMSPTEEIRTPKDDEEYPRISRPRMSPFTGSGFSYEEPKPFRRTASQRWREGQNSQSAQDFFSRASAGSKMSRVGSSRRMSRHNTSNSAISPRSEASSYLRAFSLGSSHGDNGETGDSEPVSCDSEGQTIGDDYVLGKQIGYGGFSVIKEVTQLRASDQQQRKLAVKIVRRNISGKTEAENEQAQAEFEHEVELWRFLNHPNILPLEAVYKLDEATFCFIPLNTGGTLFDLVRANRKGVSAELAKSYSYQLASALRYLHLDARVVHRDIKLENCLVEPPKTPDGPSLLRVCDFGMAEWLSNDGVLSDDPPSPDANATDRPPLRHIGPSESSTSAFAGGSLEYAAPEILRVAETCSNHPDDGAVPVERSIVSPAVDIWAYGVCVYSLLVGSRPFQNAFQPRVVMAILAGEWNRNKLLEMGGMDALELVSACLEMDKDERWDISAIVECDWLSEMAFQDEDDDAGATHGGGGWRL